MMDYSTKLRRTRRSRMSTMISMVCADMQATKVHAFSTRARRSIPLASSIPQLSNFLKTVHELEEDSEGAKTFWSV